MGDTDSNTDPDYQNLYNQVNNDLTTLQTQITTNNNEMTDLLSRELSDIGKLNTQSSETLSNLREEQEVLEENTKIINTKINTRARMIQVMQENNIYKQKVIYSFISLIFFLMILIIFFYIFFTRNT
jgi:hypothetical protein